ncbi:surfactin synthase subunit 1 [Brevibacillus sp. SKDU10]|uniref:condensation domain-containing protein n=1 Tax=Brevibacillus sp. SKDU10 TaxID=1247872 RepID=UPI0007C89541|nr:condensation domain-containing protein [Brevibacillus sp. SKDU10]OAJ72512.1 surfactin synthase subunit 1 [Brevibacillus sp. SKDU10]
MVTLVKKTVIKTYPLSKVQSVFYQHYALLPDSYGNNEKILYRIHSKINIDVMKEAFLQVIKRHEMYRTNFLMEDEPVHKVYEEAILDFEVVDASGWPQELVTRFLSEETYRPFQLEENPPFRVRLFRFSEDDFILLLVWHHVAVDGWSASLTIDDFGLLYKNLLEGNECELTPIRKQFSDFVAAQNEMLESPEGERQRLFWKEKLSGELPVLKLPADRDFPEVRTYKGGTVSFRLEKTVSDKVFAYCQQKETTLDRVLLSLYFAFLHGYSQQEEIVIGTPRYGRASTSYYNTCGVFVNLIPLRLKMPKNATYAELVHFVDEQIKQCLDYQDFPMTLMMEEQDIKTGLTPLFQTCFSIQKWPRQNTTFHFGDSTHEINLHGLQMSHYYTEKKISKFDLALYVEEDRKKGILPIFEYNADIFDKKTIEKLSRIFITFITSAMEDDQVKISTLCSYLQAIEK